MAWSFGPAGQRVTVRNRIVKRLFPKVATQALDWEIDTSHWPSVVYVGVVHGSVAPWLWHRGGRGNMRRPLGRMSVAAFWRSAGRPSHT